jgi:hypothetical protein
MIEFARCVAFAVHPHYYVKKQNQIIYRAGRHIIVRRKERVGSRIVLSIFGIFLIVPDGGSSKEGRHEQALISSLFAITIDKAFSLSEYGVWRFAGECGSDAMFALQRCGSVTECLTVRALDLAKRSWASGKGTPA